MESWELEIVPTGFRSLGSGCKSGFFFAFLNSGKAGKCLAMSSISWTLMDLVGVMRCLSMSGLRDVSSNLQEDLGVIGLS